MLLFADTQTLSVEQKESSFILKSKTDIFSPNTTYTQKPIFECTPSLKADYRYLSAKEVILYPIEMSAGTEYHCQNNPKHLKTAASFSFTSPELEVSRAVFNPLYNTLRLHFNDTVLLDKSFLSLYKKDQLEITELNYNLSTENNRTFSLYINEPTKGNELFVTVKKGLTSTHGSHLKKSFNTQFKKSASFDEESMKKKRDLLLYDNPVAVSNDDGTFSIRLFFPRYMNKSTIQKNLHIEGVKDFTLSDSRYIYSRTRNKYNLSSRSRYFYDVKADLKPQTSYTVTLKKGLSYSSYQVLKQNKSYTIKTVDRSPILRFSDDTQYLSSSGSVGFESTNIEKTTVTISKLIVDNYRYFVTLNDAKGVSQVDEVIYEKDIVLQHKKNNYVKHKFSFKPFQKEIQSGVYRVTFSYYLSKGGRQTVSKTVFVSDIGIATKVSKKSLLVSVSSLKSTQPLNYAVVDVYASNNTLLASQKTDKNGIALFEKIDSAKAKSIIVTTRDERNFLLLNNSLIQASYYTPSQSNRYKAFLYLQSELLRPGQTLNSHILLKDDTFRSGSNLPIKIKLFDPNYKLVEEKVVTLDAFGAGEYSFTFSKAMKTGRYSIKAYFANRLLTTKNINIEAFMPPKIETTLTTKKSLYGYRDNLFVDIETRYLFGAPASGLKAKINVSGVAHAYTTPLYPDYSFSDEVKAHKIDGYLLDYSSEVTLDKEGKQNTHIPLKLNQDTPSVLQAHVGVTVLDDGRPVSSYKNITVIPYDTLTGIKLDKSRIKRGDKITLHSVVFDPLTDKTYTRPLLAKIYKRQWRYSYDEKYGYNRWSKDYEPIESFTLNSGESIIKTISAAGTYMIQLYDPLSGHMSSQHLDVWWYDYVDMSPNKESQKLSIDFEDKEYKEGDNLKATIKSPILEGRLLLTLESDKFLWHQVIYVKKGTAVVNIPLEHAFRENIFLNAHMVRSTKTDTALTPFRAFNSKMVKADKSQKRLSVTLKADKSTRSNQEYRILVGTDEEADIVISVVDAGTLRMIKQKPPKLFSYFNFNPSQMIKLFDFYNNLSTHIIDGEELAFGGDGMDAMMESKSLSPKLQKRQKNIAPDNGERIKPFMFWSKILHTQQDNIASFSFNTGEFNGKAEINVMAYNKHSVGTAHQSFVIKDDIIIKPSYPRIGLIGDSYKIPVRFFNTTDVKKTVPITLTANPTLTIESDVKNITLLPNSSDVVTLTLKPEAFGKGEFTIQAGEYKKTLTLPIYSPYALTTDVRKGATTTEKSFTIPHTYMQADNANMTLTLSNSVFGRFRNDFRYLITYPYGCAEQTSSKLLAMMYAKKFIKNDTLLNDAQNNIKEGIYKLYNMQKYNGEFVYWQGGKHVSPWASLYASDVILELDADGYKVPKEMVDKIYKALDGIINAKSGYYGYSNRNIIEAAFILSKFDKLPLSVLNRLYDQKKYMVYENAESNKEIHFMMAAMLNKAGLKSEAASVLRMIDIYSEPVVKDIYGYYSYKRSVFNLLYISAVGFKQDSLLYDMVMKYADTIHSTQEKAVAMRALAYHFKDHFFKEMKAEVGLNKKTFNFHSPTVFFQPIKDDKVTLKPQKGFVNYTLEFSANIKKPIKNSIERSNKLSITRSFVDQNDKEIDLNHLKVGDRFFSKITLQNDKKLETVVINERISACFDIINQRLNGSINTPKASNFDPQFQDIRDDRVITVLDLKSGRDFYKTVYDPKQPNNSNRVSYFVPNTTVYYTPLTVTTKGICQLPAATTEVMYQPEINDYAKPLELFTIHP